MPYLKEQDYQEICRYISENLDYLWFVTDLSKWLKVSDRTVTRQFYKQTGLSFVEWLRRKRM